MFRELHSAWSFFLSFFFLFLAWMDRVVFACLGMTTGWEMYIHTYIRTRFDAPQTIPNSFNDQFFHYSMFYIVCQGSDTSHETPTPAVRKARMQCNPMRGSALCVTRTTAGKRGAINTLASERLCCTSSFVGLNEREDQFHRRASGHEQMSKGLCTILR